MRAVFIAVALCAAAAATPRVIFTKEFRGSTPAWVNITVEQTGETVYKEAPNDEYPIKFKLRDEETGDIFRLVDKLDRFSHPLESNLKVANMGTKTFRFEDGAKTAEVKFNYSLDENARALADWFERIIESEQRLIMLERTVKFDKLGVNDALLQLQVSWDKKRLVATDQYLPLLDRVIKNDSYLHMARERAAELADLFRKVQPVKSE